MASWRKLERARPRRGAQCRLEPRYGEAAPAVEATDQGVVESPKVASPPIGGPTNRIDLSRPSTTGHPLALVACPFRGCRCYAARSEEHTSELQSRPHLVCRLLLEKKKKQLITVHLVQKKKHPKQ